MTLYHYSPSPFAFDPTRLYVQRPENMKPCGLWLSVETDDDLGWKDWCESEEFNLDALSNRSEVVLAADANVLWIEDEVGIDTFTTRFFAAGSIYSSLRGIDWPSVARLYRGIIIAPYVWERRLSLHASWYYGWDCASGCIWDLSAIAEVRSDVMQCR